MGSFWAGVGFKKFRGWGHFGLQIQLADRSLTRETARHESSELLKRGLYLAAPFGVENLKIDPKTSAPFVTWKLEA